MQGDNELGSEPVESEVDSGISVATGGFVEYLIFGCVQNVSAIFGD